jgi:hypothetical protein
MHILNSCIHVHKQFTNDSSKSITETELNFWKSGHPAAWDGHHAPSFTTQRMTISLIVISVFYISWCQAGIVNIKLVPLKICSLELAIPWHYHDSFLTSGDNLAGFQPWNWSLFPLFQGQQGDLAPFFAAQRGPGRLRRPSGRPLAVAPWPWLAASGWVVRPPAPSRITSNLCWVDVGGFQNGG